MPPKIKVATRRVGGKTHKVVRIIRKRKPVSLYDIFRKRACKAFNYPDVRLCSDGDICTYLKKITA